mgnify:CR=1 FL=1
MKKILCGVLAAAMVGTVLTGCVPQKTNDSSKPSSGSTVSADNFNAEGLPILKEKHTSGLRAKGRYNKNFADLQFFQDLEEQTNVHIEWNMSSEDGWDEKKGLLFAGELPDAFYGQGILTDVDVIKYASQGILIPLEDMIEQYCPNISKLLENEEYRKALTAPDGHIYCLPSLTELSPKTHDKLFINKTWLDQLGLPLPTTLEEFENTLKAFRDNDMNGNGSTTDEIPFSFLYNRKENGLFSMFGSFGQLDNNYNNHFIVQDDEVVYTPITEPYKDAIEWFHSLYQQNLIDPEGFTHDFSVYIAKISSPDKTVGAFLGWSLSSAAGNNKADYVPLAPLKGENGEQIWNTYPSAINAKGSFVITSECENPEALMRWADLHYVPETSLQIDQGLLGTTLTKEGDRYTYLPLPEGKTLADMIHEYSPGVNGIGGVTMEIASKLDLNANLQERADLDEFYAPYNVPVEEVYPSVFLTNEEVERISELETDIVAYIDQTYANWIVNGGIDAEWDAYLQKLEQMHVQEYIEIYKAAYERYQNA